MKKLLERIRQTRWLPYSKQNSQGGFVVSGIGAAIAGAAAAVASAASAAAGAIGGALVGIGTAAGIGGGGLAAGIGGGVIVAGAGVGLATGIKALVAGPGGQMMPAYQVPGTPQFADAKAAAAEKARLRRLAIADASGTNLTSPMGLTSKATTAQKTVLGG